MAKMSKSLENMDDGELPRGEEHRTPSTVKRSALEKDDLFKARDSDLPKKRSRKRKKKKSDEDEAEEDESSSVAVEPLTIRLLAEGLVVLGRVQQVQEFGLRISLPGAITGRVSLTNISQPYSLLLRQFAQGVQDQTTEILPLQKLFQEGQTVVCKVIAAAPVEWGSSKVSVDLSLDPAAVNASMTPSVLQKGMVLQAAVSSIEDHGYTMDCGVDGVTAFLSRAEATPFIKQCNAGHALSVGQLVPCAVLANTGGGRALQLTARPSTVNAPLELEEFSLDYVLPGFRAEVTVIESQSEGLVVSWNGIEACVHRSHLPGPWDSPEDITVGQTLVGTLLYVQPLVQRPYLSLQKPSSRGMFGAIRPGALLEGAAEVVAIEAGAVHLRLEPSGLRALCPRPLVADEDVEDARDFVTAGERLSCRVMALSYMDKVVVVSLKKSMLSEKYVTPDALVPGAKFECTVRQMQRSGILVSLSPWMAGFIQKLHVSGPGEEQPTLGSKVRCRLLNVDRSFDPPRLLLTCRRALVTSKRPLITSYDDCIPGKLIEGLIVHATPQGLLVTFYNNIKGWVPSREMPHSGHGTNANYTEGKVVTCRVVDCQPSEERLTLSLKLAPKGEQEQEKQSAQEVTTSTKSGAMEVGTLVSGCVEAKVKDGFTVRLRTGESASLPKQHLSDFEPHCVRLQQLLAEGTNLTNLVIFNSSESLVVSRRTSLVNAAQRGLLVSHFEDMAPGTLVFGVLLAFVRHGMLLELPGGIRGFVPLKDVSDEFITDACKSGFVIGQCLVGRVTKVDSEKQQVWLSTSMRSCGEKNFGSTMECLAAQLTDEELISRLEQTQDPIVGSIVRVTVQDVDEENQLVHCKIAESTLSATAETVPGRSIASGSTHEAVVLHCSTAHSNVELCLDPQVVRSVSAARRTKPVLRRIQSGRLLHLKPSHAVVLLHSGHLCLVPTKSHFNSTFHLPLEKKAIVSVWTWKHCGNVIVGCTKATLDYLGHKEVAKFHPRKEKEAASDTVVQPSKDSCPDSGKLRPNVDGEELAHGKLDVKTQHRKQKKSQVEQDCHMDEPDIDKGKNFGNRSSGTAAVEEDNLERTVGMARGSETVSPSLQPRGIVSQKLSTKKQNMRSIMAIVRSVEKLQLKITLENGYKGRVHVSFIDANPKEGESPLKRFEPGDQLEVYVIERVIPLHSRALAITGRRNFCECSLFPAEKNEFAPAPGSEVIGYFSHFSEGSLVFALTHNKMGRLPVLNMDLPPSRLGYIHTELKAGQAVKVKVLRADESSVVELSQLGVTTLTVDSVVNGYVVSARAGVGACVSLPLGHRGTISITDICDDFSQAATLMANYVQERYLRCYIQDIDSETNTYHLSTRESRLHPESCKEIEDKEIVALSSITVGTTLRGFVKTVNKHGCFVTVGCGVVGLIPLSKLPAHLQRSHKAMKIGELVSVVVKRIQASERRLFLGLVHRVQANATLPRKRKLSNSSADELIFDSSEKKIKLDDPLPRLSLDEGFSWDVEATPDLGKLLEERPAVNSSDDEDGDDGSAKKSRKEIRQEREQAEAQLRKKERMLVDPSREPETVDDFDRLVLVSPNSSIVWLRYMAFHLRQAEIEKARAVARRALSCIDFREEQEKLNVWTALLNLEHLYGTQDSLDSVFKEALQFNEPLKVYMHLAQIYVEGNKREQAEQLYKQTLNKFKQHADVWLSFGLFYMKCGQIEACRALLQRALKSLPSREHVVLITKFAQMEFKYGDAERGQSMFNSILDNYPKRTDLWIVYVDILTKLGDVDNARKTFEKATSLNLNPKKMKSLFKKWLDFEKEHGDASLCEVVKQHAVQYVQQRTAKSTHM